MRSEKESKIEKIGHFFTRRIFWAQFQYLNINDKNNFKLA